MNVSEIDINLSNNSKSICKTEPIQVNNIEMHIKEE